MTEPDANRQPETRRRLLEAAGEVFAERGFRAATTREICRRAGANVAAIHYHFGDKERLYEEVLRFAHRESPSAPPPRAAGAPDSREERLRAFVEWLLFRLLGEDRRAWQWRLLAREIAEPSPALDALVESDLRPAFERLEALCREFLGEGATPAQLSLAARSVVGQCLYYRFAQPVIARLAPAQRYGPEDVRRLVDHITRFSIAGLRSVLQGSYPVSTEKEP